MTYHSDYKVFASTKPSVWVVVYTHCPECGSELDFSHAEVYLDKDGNVKTKYIKCVQCSKFIQPEIELLSKESKEF